MPFVVEATRGASRRILWAETTSATPDGAVDTADRVPAVPRRQTSLASLRRSLKKELERAVSISGRGRGLWENCLEHGLFY